MTTTEDTLRTQLADAEARADALHAKLTAIEELIVPDGYVYRTALRAILDQEDAASAVDFEWKVWIPASPEIGFDLFGTEAAAYEAAANDKHWLSTWAREVAVRRLYRPGPWVQLTNLTPPSTGTQLL
jgi:hypothetical protein